MLIVLDVPSWGKLIVQRDDGWYAYYYHRQLRGFAGSFTAAQRALDQIVEDGWREPQRAPIERRPMYIIHMKGILYYPDSNIVSHTLEETLDVTQDDLDLPKYRTAIVAARQYALSTMSHNWPGYRWSIEAIERDDALSA